jgi:hypothetical protein
MIHRVWRSGLALAALTLLLALPVLAGEMVPWRGTLEALVTRTTVLLGPGPGQTRPRLVRVDWIAEGGSTHTGRFTAVGSHLSFLDDTQPTFGEVSGSAILTAANGDQLFVDLFGTRPVTLVREGVLTVRGGTGRFRGATGSAPFVSHDINNVNGLTLGFVVDFDGLISSVGSNRR